MAETRLAGNERDYLNQCVQELDISSRGPFVAAFENAFGHYLACKHAVACSSGTVALHLLLAALGLGPGDGVIIPAFTMIAVANAVRYTGAFCKLVGSESRHLNLDPACVKAAVTPRTRAIIAVHTYGHPRLTGAPQNNCTRS